ncbi:MAG: winged helix-turn-helix domain-containing protein [Kiritimatiellae bacterium]|nr:winged helix-turn-helix domain-containing protein [Kiritimatiellia bacterium]
MSAKKKTASAPAKAAPAEPAAKMSLMKAAAAILREGGGAMNTKELVRLAKERGLWVPGEGKTPEQTLYSAIVREIREKGAASRFKKDSRGLFAFNG